MNRFILLLLPLSCGFTSCITTQIVEETHVSVEGHDILFLESTIPKNKIEEYNRALLCMSRAIYSEEFPKELTKFVDNLKTEEQINTWKDLNVNQIVADMKSKISGLSFTTDTGLSAYWNFYIYGNLAFEGDSLGPIRLNGVPFHRKKWTSADISNSISHELAHRIGLVHPNNKPYEPPYAIGNIIQKIVSNQCK